MAYKGKWRPKNIEKYEGNPSKIVYRSLWERQAFKWCDSNPSVVKWSSEEVVVPYISKTDGKRHRYFVDLKITYDTGKTILVEIKPKAQTKPPKKRKRTSRYLYEIKTWGVNQAKWEAADAVCKRNGWKFIILTEDHLNTHKYISNK